MSKTGAGSNESALVLDCEGYSLLAIHHAPVQACDCPGVVLVVGGPQYRVGSHRQFVLLARFLAEQGVPVLRFDYRGMGDSEGALRDFSDVNTDIRVAVDALVDRQPDMPGVVIWGLCDAASAAGFYACTDARISGLVLVNPWVRTDSGEARVYLKHYYWQRLQSREFWGKVLCLRFDVAGAVSSLWALLRRARGTAVVADDPAVDDSAVDNLAAQLPLPERMLHGLSAFDGKVLLLLSGEDLVAREFEDLTGSSAEWQAWMARDTLTLQRLPEADHTFSRQVWRDQVADWTHEWLKQ